MSDGESLGGEAGAETVTSTDTTICGVLWLAEGTGRRRRDFTRDFRVLDGELGDRHRSLVPHRSHLLGQAVSIVCHLSVHVNSGSVGKEDR